MAVKISTFLVRLVVILFTIGFLRKFLKWNIEEVAIRYKGQKGIEIIR